MTTEFNEETFKKEAGVDYGSWYQLNKRMKAGETLQGDDVKIYTNGLNVVIKLTGQKEITDKVLSLEDTVKSEREEIGQLQDLVLKKEDELVKLQDKTREYEAKIKAYEENPNTGASSAQVRGLFEEVKDLRAQLETKTKEIENYKNDTKGVVSTLEQVKDELKQREKYIEIKEGDIRKRESNLTDRLTLLESCESGKKFSKFLQELWSQARSIDEEQKYVDWAVRIDPNNVEALVASSILYLEKDDLENALIVAEKIIELNKEDDRAYRIKANVLLKQGKDEDALKFFTETVSRDKRDALSFARMSQISYKLNDPAAAVEYYVQASSIAINILEHVTPEQKKLFEGFEKLDPKKFQDLRANAKEKIHHFDRHKIFDGEFCEEDGTPVLNPPAQKSQRAARLDYVQLRALENLERIVLPGKPNEEKAHVWLEKGLELDRAGKILEAVEAYTNAIKLSNGNDAAILLYLENRGQERIAKCESIENGADIWYRVGKAFEEVGKLDNALMAYTHAIAGLPNDKNFANSKAALEEKIRLQKTGKAADEAMRKIIKRAAIVAKMTTKGKLAEQKKEAKEAKQKKSEPKDDKEDNVEFECPGCGATVSESDKKCPECGGEFE
jgi:tetratricopeptide (TPR) repeat protein